MKRVLLTTICFLSAIMVMSQTGDLTENANAIVEDFSAVYTQTDVNNATYRVTKTVTILNRQGEGFGHFYARGDKFTELKDFAGVVKNSAGKTVKKIGEKDLTISSISEHLNTDDYDIEYICKHPVYPYTVEYTYQQKIKDGIIGYPVFAPVDGYMQSVKQANYTIELPAGTNLRYHSNFDCDIKEGNAEDKHTYTFSAKDMVAIEYEPMAPISREIFPLVYIAPVDFCFDSFCGNMSDWNNYGSWMTSLLKDRDILPVDVVTEMQDMTKNAGSDREKVAILYKYLQDNTRYVSIQLGIGGYRPIEATPTLKSRFGDCKGLTNLMKALLKTVGIPSYYSVINLGNDKVLLPDFPNFNQANHVILLVPLQGDSIWLECTSATTPFGYVHDGIAGHDALVVTDTGGKICRLPVYTGQQNRKEAKLLINIAEDGVAKGSIGFTEHLSGYDMARGYIMSGNREKEVEYINGNVSIPKLQLGQIHASEDRSALPFCSLTADYEAFDFANKTGSRLFIPACPLKKSNYNIFPAAKRNLDIDIRQGFSESDSIIINVPASYTPESLPKNIAVETDFGTFSTKCVVEGNRIVYTQNTSIHAGRYSKDRYQELKGFFGEISSAIKRKMVLKKSE